MMHHDRGRRNRRPLPVTIRARMAADNTRSASYAAAWLVRRFRVRPLLAETVAGLAGLGGVRHG
jgi:hypothetical protein